MASAAQREVLRSTIRGSEGVIRGQVGHHPQGSHTYTHHMVIQTAVGASNGAGNMYPNPIDLDAP